MADKATKASVEYGSGKGMDRCAKCVHFDRPDRCELVQGIIHPRDWCNLFEASRKT